MATKKKKEVIEVVETPTRFLKSELILILPLFRVCQTELQKLMVLNFYKKYVNPRFNGTLSECCSNKGFMGLKIETRDWISKNNRLFIN